MIDVMNVECRRLLMFEPGILAAPDAGQLRREVYAHERNGRNVPRGRR